MEGQKCRVCGCTDDNCAQCIKLTGHPCHWVEEDLCSACAEAIKQQSSKSNTDMNFFQQLTALGQVDLTMRIMQKNDKLTLNIMPGNGSASIQPIIVTGTPVELDNEFFKSLAPGVVEVGKLISNLDEVKKEAQQKVEAKDKPKPTQNKPEKKEEKKKQMKPEVKESSLFDAPAETEDNENSENDQTENSQQ